MSNVIEITFGEATSAVTEEKAYQYDYGQELKFTDLTLPEHFEVHFSNIKIGKASIAIGHNNQVTIPDAYLKTGMPVYGWVYLHETPADGETAYSFRIPVVQRARPSDQLTPEQETLIATILALLEHPTEHIEEEIQEALAAAKASGEFDGYSPTVDITEDEDGTYIVTVTDAEGEHEYELNAGSYKNLSSKPSINGVTLDGNKNFTQLGLASASDLATALSQLTVDSEVQNIRTGDDGVEYQSAGIAVRTQFSNLKADNNQSLYGKSVLAKDINDFKSTTLYKVDGTTTTLSYRYSTDFIDVSDYYLIEYGAIGLTNPRLALVAFFDANQMYLSSSLESFSGNNIEGKIYVPTNAKYVRVITQSGVAGKSYVYGYASNSLKQEQADDSEEVGANVDLTYELNPVFNDGHSYYTDGTAVILSSRYTSEYIKCDGFDYIEYGLSGLTGANHLNVVSFFDGTLTYVSGVPSTKNSFETGIAKVPSNAVFVKGNKLSSSSEDHYMRGVKSASVDRRLTTVELLVGKKTNAVASVVTPEMSVAEFRDAYNAELSNFATRIGCSSNSLSIISIAETTWEQVYPHINRTFRAEVYVSGMPHDVVCDRVNHAFAEDIWMWKDAKYNDGTARDFSLAFPERSGEPSAIVSPDGGTLYVYGYNGRWATNDGLHWSAKETLLRTGSPSGGGPEHANTNYIDGIYYMFGPLSTGDRELSLFTSTDGVNFEYKGMPLKKTDITVDGESVQIWGNSYMVEDSGTYYLYIEAKLTNNVNFWDIYLCTCTDPLLDNGDGTVGDWTYSGTGAIVGDLFQSSSRRAHGNPDFAKDPDNRPIRINGYWYMYYHVTYNGAMYIYRAKSNDLRTWTVEGYIINNRDVPTAGEGSAGNADHALIEFKGKTYLFYTWDINSQYTPYIKYVVDDRPFRELLKMYP